MTQQRDRKWESRLSLLSRPRLALGMGTVFLSAVLAIVGFVSNEGFTASMGLLLIVVFLAARGGAHPRLGRGWAFLIAGWAVGLVAWGGLFGT